MKISPGPCGPGDIYTLKKQKPGSEDPDFLWWRLLDSNQ